MDRLRSGQIRRKTSYTLNFLGLVQYGMEKNMKFGSSRNVKKLRRKRGRSDSSVQNSIILYE